ncbi:MAG: tetratricopeptide repeat protein [Chloroflexi bacterium AL-W]|nr:tetratricopeptide repeat protein [Chloroflexi bacterium AL-N1]NOK68144.1 tetratricopeptide repeat protein [Chloroflexi bacterium AL-N10]NOK73484.1 tetratricopeptide repeat protein [Chloroflexi bacterium AL-N5]NOK83398.1 tetratricopeptide repeat protein [Chloroflexi bacterium AL-W]NOK87815.1 tetratricopeptide repeat protein [Chloroflexi bacterium AL-N15]
MIQQQTAIARWCERIVEGGWLLAVVFIPSYFNLLSSRHFEPDKSTSLRAIVLVMAAAAIIRWLEGLNNAPPKPKSEDTAKQPPGRLKRIWSRITSVPLSIPVLVYIVVFLFATIVSVTPYMSFWGSYQRLQGTYTHLSYIALGAIVVLNMRRREQLERLVTISVLGSLVAVGYGLIQHYQLDPLPWGGDVVSRIASTMGNSIFVAAYFIMIIPFALYLTIAAAHTASQSPSSKRPGVDWGWAISYVLLVLGSLAIVFAAIQFVAVVRTNDLRYWWVYPGSLVVAFLLYLVPTLRPHSADRINISMLLPGIVAITYVLMLGLFFSSGQSTGGQEVRPYGERGGTEWPIWMIGGIISIIVSYTLMFVLPRRSSPQTALFMRLQSIGMLIITLLLLVVTFYTQSRGPWIGAGAGLFVFFTLLLWKAWQRARTEGLPRATLWRNLLIGEIALTIAMGAFIVIFNFSNAPVFVELREVPYIGRMGRLLDTSPGTTGDVRMKIWFGDEITNGAVGLITSNPVRALVGWGPESMFVAYNPFYPPSLANVEARGASPDRSHQAYLDELVTKGLFGLISYLFVILSFFALAWRLLQRVTEWRMQVLFIACISIVVAHSVEGLTGIPIVATLMLLWIAMAVLVVSGSLAGQYSLDGQEPDLTEAASESPEPVERKGQKATKGRGSRRQTAAGHGSRRTGSSRRRATGSSGLLGGLLYTIIAVIAFAFVWSINVSNVFADMRFQQGKIYTESAQANLQRHLEGLTFFVDAINLEPEQDFYYLSLGRNLMSLVDIRRQMDGTEFGETVDDARVETLLRQPNDQSIQQFVLEMPLQELMSYAEAVLLRAYEINPRNKDHSANLGRLYSFWYSRLTQDPAQLQQALEWYERANEAAPNDVVIMNEYARTYVLLAEVNREQPDQTVVQEYYEQANALLSEAKRLDPLYSETELLLADVLRLQGNYTEATDRYLVLLKENPQALSNQIELIATSMQSEPEQLQRLLEGYEATVADETENPAPLYAIIGRLAFLIGDLPGAEAAYASQVELEPNNAQARQNYTLVLSDTQQYQRAASEAEVLLTLVQSQDQQRAVQVQVLIDYLKNRAAGD